MVVDLHMPKHMSVHMPTYTNVYTHLYTRVYTHVYTHARIAEHLRLPPNVPGFGWKRSVRSSRGRPRVGWGPRG